jgi:hypothetical protein
MEIDLYFVKQTSVEQDLKKDIDFKAKEVQAEKLEQILLYNKCI